jgi:hypothetical protein
MDFGILCESSLSSCTHRQNLLYGMMQFVSAEALYKAVLNLLNNNVFLKILTEVPQQRRARRTCAENLGYLRSAVRSSEDYKKDRRVREADKFLL